MHIPNEMLNGAICPVTAAISVAGIGTAAFFAAKSKNKPTALKIGAVGALIFAAQMMNFPVQNGTSGHLIGATLATSLLGMPFGVIVMSIVLAVQCLIFSDGGLSVLGANILNMALIGSIAGGLVNMLVLRRPNKSLIKDSVSLGIASWLSVILAALACSIELGISGTIQLSKVLPAMLGVHALIGIGEAVITITAYLIFSSEKLTTSKKLSFGIPLLSAGIIGLLLSPFASGFPDGLEWIAEKYSFLHEAAPAFVSPMPDYTMPPISNEMLSTSIAGLLGVAITFGIIWGIAKLLSLSNSSKLS